VEKYGMRKITVCLAALLMLGCETQLPQRSVVFESSRVLKVNELVLKDGRRIAVPPPIAWDTNTEVFRQWSRVGNVTDLQYKDSQGRLVVGNFFCIYQKTGASPFYAYLSHAIRYRADGTREIQTDYNGNGSPSGWICYGEDGKHPILRVKECLDRDETPRLQWAAVAGKDGHMQAYGVMQGESDQKSSVRVGSVEINEPLE
jgi:hypothetical protein